MSILDTPTPAEKAKAYREEAAGYRRLVDSGFKAYAPLVPLMEGMAERAEAVETVNEQ